MFSNQTEPDSFGRIRGYRDDRYATLRARLNPCIICENMDKGLIISLPIHMYQICFIWWVSLLHSGNTF